MFDHPLTQIIAAADSAINDENFDALMAIYAPEATLVIAPGRNAIGLESLRKAFVAIAEHFNHTLHVTQGEMQVIEGADTALVVAKTRVTATMKTGERYDVERKATYVFRRIDGRWLCAVDNSYGTDLLSAGTPASGS